MKGGPPPLVVVLRHDESPRHNGIVGELLGLNFDRLGL
jgi:hypothetical protein